MIKSFSILALIVASSMNAMAGSPAKDAACSAFQNAALAGRSSADRLKLTLTSINISYGLNYTPAQLAQLDKKITVKINAGQMKLDNLERAGLLGCMNSITADESAGMKKALDSI